jgi:hypothetical protein
MLGALRSTKPSEILPGKSYGTAFADILSLIARLRVRPRRHKRPARTEKRDLASKSPQSGKVGQEGNWNVTGAFQGM